MSSFVEETIITIENFEVTITIANKQNKKDREFILF